MSYASTYNRANDFTGYDDSEAVLLVSQGTWNGKVYHGRYIFVDDQCFQLSESQVKAIADKPAHRRHYDFSITFLEQSGWYGKVYGKKGSYMIYLDNEPRTITDDCAEKITAWMSERKLQYFTDKKAKLQAKADKIQKSIEKDTAEKDRLDAKHGELKTKTSVKLAERILKNKDALADVIYDIDKVSQRLNELSGDNTNSPLPSGDNDDYDPADEAEAQLAYEECHYDPSTEEALIA